MPRILEQSLCTRDIETKDSLSFKLNGSSVLVLFTYTSWDPAMLDWKIKEQVTAKQVEILIDGNVVRVVGSIEMCATILGLSRNTGRRARYMNHVKSVYSKHLNANVNVRFPQSATKTNPIIHRNNNEINIPSLIIPDKSLYDLELHLLYVFDSNFNQIGVPFLSIAKAVEYLNPSLSDKTDRRGREVNSARLTNKAILITHELGQFYFA